MPTNSKSKRTQQLADSIKNWIVEQGLQPGDRLPSELQSMETFGASKSTVRESMRILEAQGILKTKTGPKGGIFVSKMTESKAQSLLSNYLFFKGISITDIYQIRQALEPQVAASLAGKLTQEQLQKLELQIKKYTQAPKDVYEEKLRHIHSIEFHSILVSYSDNELLKFIVRFAAQLLTNLTIYKRLYEPKNTQLWKTGIESHTALVEALRSGNKTDAFEIMSSHMQTAHQLMKLQEAEISQQFLAEC